MNLFEDKEFLSKNTDFETSTENENNFFVHKSGHKIATDQFGKMIWNCLPGKAEEIKERVKKELAVSDRLVNEFLYVLLRADLMKSSLNEKREISPLLENEVESSDVISVIVITHNGIDHVLECFRSIFNQTHKHLDVIAVDNGSHDKTVTIIKCNFPQVRIFSLRKNLHYSGGVNFGIKKAKGKYLFVLNQDVALEKNCINRLYKRMRGYKRVAAVVPMMKFYYLKGFINGIGNHIRNHGWGSDNFIGHVDIGQFADLKEVPSACFGAVFLNREAIDQVGLLDEKYESFYEDVDWSFRCWMRGWKIIPEVRAVVYHKFGASFLDKIKLRLVVRNRMRLVLKIFQIRVMFGFLKGYLKEDVKNFLSFLKKKEYSSVLAYIKAYFSLFLSIYDIFLKRIRFKKKDLLERSEVEVLEKNPVFYSCMNENNLPQINANVMFGCYRWEFRKKFTSRQLPDRTT